MPISRPLHDFLAGGEVAVALSNNPTPFARSFVPRSIPPTSVYQTHSGITFSTWSAGVCGFDSEITYAACSQRDIPAEVSGRL